MNSEYTVFWLTWYNLDERLHRRCLESVLNQTNPNLILVIRDNGSTDGSNELIKEYAEKDNRILFYRNEVGYQLDESEKKQQQAIFDKIFSDKRIAYSVMIDHDDFYASDFLEKAICNQKITDADMVCVSTGFYNDESEKVVGLRTIDENVFIENRKIINGNFQQIYQFLRTNWGKLYTMETYKKVVEISRNQPRHINGPSDTYVNLNLFKQISKISFIKEPLHFYVSVNDSHYKRIQTDENIKAFKVLYELGKELALYYECYCEEVEEFLQRVYAYSMNDIIRNIVCNNSLDFHEKLDRVNFILDQQLFSEIVLHDMQYLDIWFDYLGYTGEKEAIDSNFSVLNNANNEFNEIFNQYIYLSENENYKSANYYLNALIIWKPYMRDFIYYKIFLCYKLNNLIEYKMFCNYAIQVFKNDIEILNLIRNINSEWSGQ